MIAIIISLRDGMGDRVFDSGEHSKPFKMTNGVTQGYALAMTLFGIVVALMYPGI